jgi:NTP pyrophosphatase (non-canonical NTP hydrolase)
MDIEWGSMTAIRALTRLDLLPLGVDDRLESRRVDCEVLDDVVVEHDRSTARNRAERELGLLWGTELADDEDVERRAERERNCTCDGHAAARKSEHQYVGPTTQVLEQRRQLAAGILPIRKDGPIMDLDRFQTLMRDTYGERDRTRGTPSAVAWLAEEVGELAQAVRKGTPEQQLVELADVLAWLASIADQLGLSLDDATRRYTNGCPRCGEIPCRCPL